MRLHAFLVLTTGAGLLSAARAEPSATDLEFFEKKVRPILVERCYECHSAEAGKSKGGLTVDSRPALLKGGDNGPALIAGVPDKSLLITAIRYQKRELQMPPKSPLPAAEQRVLEEWVKRGAPDPRHEEIAASVKPRPVDVEQGRRHWAFRPVAEVPTPKNGHPVDAFLQARLAEKGLEFAPPADPATFLRRITFDLTGLPPTPEELAGFIADHGAAPEAAVRRLVDRLLASPHYGEKWGRHWLDVARYADSNGLDENIALGTAWRYRDYVVRAFNHDKPFDRFLTEQIAGDLLPARDLAERQEHATATAFLNLGAKVLAEPDKEKLAMDVIDEQLETTGRAFLGMTLGCVRCHDHKFDPVTQADYYALAAIFKSTQSFSSDRMGALSLAHETPLGDFEDFAAVKIAEQALASKKMEVSAAQSEAKKKPDPDAEARVMRLMDEMEAIEKSLPDLPTAIGVRDAEAIQPKLAIHIRGSHLSLGKEVPRGFIEVMQSPGAAAPAFPRERSGRLELARWLTDPAHPVTARVIVNRVWTWHFGRGIVGTPDNFGLLGDAPSHPELLDWLARWLPANGWSLKDLHRLILTSRAYRQGGREKVRSPQAAETDPENRLLHHFPMRRLEAEELRDSLLAVAGLLDLNMGGKTVPLRNRQFVFNHTSKDLTKYDSLRRAIYLPVIRNNLYDLFQQFDYPDPAVSTGQRNSTIVSPQALLLMNSPLASQAAAGLASRLQRQEGNLEARVRRAVALAYGRAARSDDLQNARNFLAAADASLASQVEAPAKRERQAWELLCQAWMMTNEFLYLR
jgi:hypothetical protein